YRLALPPPRHSELRNYRALVIDSHPLIATAADVTSALQRLASRLEALGVKTARASPLLPDLAHASKIYTQLLTSIFGAYLPLERYTSTAAAAKALPASDDSLTAWRTRSTVL